MWREWRDMTPVVCGLLATAAAMTMMVVPGSASGMPESATPKALETLGLNHIGFAVNKLEASRSFFVDTLGWRVVGGDLDYPAVFVTNGDMFVTLWQTEEQATVFDRHKNIGLHHMAITVRDLGALDQLHRKFLARSDVKIEFAPEFMGQGPTTHMMIREPSGLRLEFIVPASRMTENKNGKVSK